MADYKKLAVWRKSHLLALNASRIALRIRGMPYSGVRSQIIRAAQSIPANIVEGRSQASDADFLRFLRYAVGSAAELEYHLIFVRDLELLPKDDCHHLLGQVVEVRKMLHGLVNTIEKARSNQQKS